MVQVRNLCENGLSYEFLEHNTGHCALYRSPFAYFAYSSPPLKDQPHA